MVIFSRYYPLPFQEQLTIKGDCAFREQIMLKLIVMPKKAIFKYSNQDELDKLTYGSIHYYQPTQD